MKEQKRRILLWDEIARKMKTNQDFKLFYDVLQSPPETTTTLVSSVYSSSTALLDHRRRHSSFNPISPRDIFRPSSNLVSSDLLMAQERGNSCELGGNAKKDEKSKEQEQSKTNQLWEKSLSKKETNLEVDKAKTLKELKVMGGLGMMSSKEDFLLRELLYECWWCFGVIKVLWISLQEHWRWRMKGSKVSLEESSRLTEGEEDESSSFSSEEGYKTAELEVTQEPKRPGTIFKLFTERILQNKGVGVAVPAEFAVVLVLVSITFVSLILLLLLLTTTTTTGPTSNAAATTSNVGFFTSLAQAVSMSVSRVLADQERTFSFGLSVSCTVICSSCGLTLYLFFLYNKTICLSSEGLTPHQDFCGNTSQRQSSSPPSKILPSSRPPSSPSKPPPKSSNEKRLSENCDLEVQLEKERHHEGRTLHEVQQKCFLHKQFKLINHNVVKHPYYILKFALPDKFLFPLFWTALLADYNFRNSGLAHALSIALAIKFLNYFHHYFYYYSLEREEKNKVYFSKGNFPEGSSFTTREAASQIPSVLHNKSLLETLCKTYSESEKPTAADPSSKEQVNIQQGGGEICQLEEDLLSSSSRVSIGFFAYFILIRRLGSLVWTSYPILTHFLGICGLLLGQICVNKLGHVIPTSQSQSHVQLNLASDSSDNNKHLTDISLSQKISHIHNSSCEYTRVEENLQETTTSSELTRRRRRSGNPNLLDDSTLKSRVETCRFKEEKVEKKVSESFGSNSRYETRKRVVEICEKDSHHIPPEELIQKEPAIPRVDVQQHKVTNREEIIDEETHKTHHVSYLVLNLGETGNFVSQSSSSNTDSKCGGAYFGYDEKCNLKDTKNQENPTILLKHCEYSSSSTKGLPTNEAIKYNVNDKSDSKKSNFSLEEKDKVIGAKANVTTCPVLLANKREAILVSATHSAAAAGGIHLNPLKIAESSWTAGESISSELATTNIGFTSSPPPKRLFRSGSQCLVSGLFNNCDRMRRTSLPAALPAQRLSIHHGSGGVDTALLYEAHGLVTEMLLDQAALPANIVAGLKALATLLKPIPAPIHYTPRPRPAPLTLSTDPDYTSDVDEIPYTGEKLSSMPKRNSGVGKKGVSGNLLRRMSTSTWTTTTSATGMPTLEPQPHSRRRRSASFRSQMEGTPGSSPTQQYGLIPLGSFSDKESSSRENGTSSSGKCPSISPALTNFKLGTINTIPGSGFSSGHSTPHIPNAALQASHKARSFSAIALYASSDLTHLSALAASTGISTSGSGVIKSVSASVSAAGSNRSSPVGTPVPSPLPSPIPSRDPSPCNYSTRHQQQRDSSSAAGDLPRTSLIDSSSTSSLCRKSISPSNSTTNLVAPIINPPSNSPTASSTIDHPQVSCSRLENRLRDYSPPKVIFQSTNDKPETGSCSLNDGDSLGLLSGKNLTTSPYLDNPDEDCSNASTLGDGPGPPDDSSGNSNSVRLSPVTFTLQEPTDNDQEASAPLEDDFREAVIVASDGVQFNLPTIASDTYLCRLSEWDYPIFDLERSSKTQILSHMCYKVFLETGLFETFKIPIREFINYFHALEMGYREKPYHNRMHAADVLQGVFYFTTQAIPGFQMVPPDPDTPNSDWSGQRACFNVDEASYGIMGANFPALELMALYTAAAMHDYDHPGRTNAFLVTTHSPQAILYNDRSVLENHHAAAAWGLLLNNEDFNFLKFLDKAEFKRFRFLVIEAILATDLKRHFEILSEFNSKVNEDDSPGIDWASEEDRLLVMEICIKLADINGPCKFHDIHVQWTYRIAEEFYEQGDEEVRLGLPISPFMDRYHPQLAKLQESFINHLVAPLCKACAESGLLPGYWEDDVDDEQNEGETTADEVSIISCQEMDYENDESSYSDDNKSECKRKIFCLHTKHLQDNHRYWMNVIKEEAKKKEEGVKTESVAISTEDPMETIEEENNTPHSLNRSFSFEKEDSKL